MDSWRTQRGRARHSVRAADSLKVCARSDVPHRSIWIPPDRTTLENTCSNFVQISITRGNCRIATHHNDFTVDPNLSTEHRRLFVDDNCRIAVDNDLLKAHRRRITDDKDLSKQRKSSLDDS